MSEEEVEKIMQELYEVRPEMLNDKARDLFNAIIKIADDKDKILDMMREQQKEIEELKDSNNKLYEIGQEIKIQHKYTSENYISKSKIEDKIKEILTKGKNMTKEERQIETEYMMGKLRAYEELLEE